MFLISSILISITTFELLNFEKWPQVVQQNLKYGEESSPVKTGVSFTPSKEEDFDKLSVFS